MSLPFVDSSVKTPPSPPWGGLLRLLGCCASCQSWSRDRVCLDCTRRFATPGARCPRCAARVVPGVVMCGPCVLKPPAFDAAWAAVDYAFPWSTLMARFKFRQALDLAPAFSELMADRGPGAAGCASPWLVPVPLSRERLRQRGYNQAWELARRLARHRAWPARPEVLRKVRDTPEQMDLPPVQRQANVRDAFEVSAHWQPELRGRTVILVDDVMTTGATVDALARQLKEAGAASVGVWVFARTPPPSQAP